MTKHARTAPELRLIRYDSAKLRSDNESERDRAWRRLADVHYDRVYRLVARFGVESAEVEDLVQRTFVIAFRRMSEIDRAGESDESTKASEIRDPGAWLRGIAVRVVAQHRRWRGVREAKRWILRANRIGVPSAAASPEHCTSAAQELESVRRIMDQLTPKLRDVLVLCDIEELKPGEAARLLSVSVNTVRSRRRLAKEKFLVLWRQQEGEE